MPECIVAPIALAPVLADIEDFGGIIIFIIFLIIMVFSSIAEAKKKQEVQKRKQQIDVERKRSQTERPAKDREAWEPVEEPQPAYRPAPAPKWEPAVPSSRPMEVPSSAQMEQSRLQDSLDKLQHQAANVRDAQARADAIRARHAASVASRQRELERAAAAQPPAAPPKRGLTGGLSHSELARAVVLAEVLGPPVALREESDMRDRETPHRLV